MTIFMTIIEVIVFLVIWLYPVKTKKWLIVRMVVSSLNILLSIILGIGCMIISAGGGDDLSTMVLIFGIIFIAQAVFFVARLVLDIIKIRNL